MPGHSRHPAPLWSCSICSAVGLSGPPSLLLSGCLQQTKLPPQPESFLLSLGMFWYPRVGWAELASNKEGLNVIIRLLVRGLSFWHSNCFYPQCDFGCLQFPLWSLEDWSCVFHSVFCFGSLSTSRGLLGPRLPSPCLDRPSGLLLWFLFLHFCPTHAKWLIKALFFTGLCTYSPSF